ncbi:hypothetical protein DKG34_00420 [Streptomyces sp. NWU49]|nr:hypothetical protein DKG34_00420 [Streptomyces sp. NWU49]
MCKGAKKGAARANGSRRAAWEFFGAELKRRREEAGFTQVEPGARVFLPGGHVGQFEQAVGKPRSDAAQRIDAVLRTGGVFERLCRKPIDDRRCADCFAEVVELEKLATTLCESAPALVPGLLRTAGCARGDRGAPGPDRVGGRGTRTMRAYDLSDARRRRSSYSDGEGGSCVEVAGGVPGMRVNAPTGACPAVRGRWLPPWGR